MAIKKHAYDQVVYLLQGGGALGSYQAGVCEVLLEHDYAPDWVVGTSIGAINAAIIAGNKPQDRTEKLHKFWDMVSFPFPSVYFTGLGENFLLHEYYNYIAAFLISMTGQSHFFKPRLIAPLFFSENSPDKISFYDTSKLHETLKEVIDFKLINKNSVRLTLGAINVKGGKAARFDNTHQKIGPEHIMASSALPPGFPAVKIEEEYFWDGGLSSNTPFAVVLEEKIPQRLLCFIMNLFSCSEQLPTSLQEILKYKKEIEYSSRHKEVLHYFCELHYLQHTIDTLAKTIVHNHDLDAALKKIKEIGHPASLNIVRFHYHDRRSNLWSKDYNFSVDAIKEHWHAGFNDAKKALIKPPWLDEVTSDSGATIHEF